MKNKFNKYVKSKEDLNAFLKYNEPVLSAYDKRHKD
jgi:hypothetical protein